ncbi:dinitrogenase iron-molybdenum cofactor biosynthesis [Lucifera butyrica]|uniref:FeMo cofactor biosynthesis protein NifB n=1 Tax=Lucifera butyrica TaxID=1351585 RepID=A0A498R8Y5_9FIRM|nr:nitrogenase cofactor biosynthesis protein NifB [Lucifera butyrica]VBB07455.1 dinitrogenase iron-molybdenum cofactor biosynthesis [Lucifera butyrica]
MGCSYSWTEKHPCFSLAAHHKYARMHLPVAPLCNISCNYCNRQYDCVNESRPGVTSEILSPAAARQKFDWVREKIDNLSVIGIAGPGDALANWQETRETIELIRDADAGILVCLSTNGLMLPAYVPEIVELGISHVTVTVNCLEPEIGAQIYRFVSYQGKTYTGAEGAGILLQNQMEGITYLAGNGVVVKVNIVMIPGINDFHIPEVVAEVKAKGAFITNIMPLIPAGGSVFQHFPQTSMKAINDMRNRCQADLPQMRHCRQCRADAIGLLGEDRSQEFCLRNRDKERKQPAMPPSKPVKIAVTSRYGRLVDLHFGHAAEFLIFQGSGPEFHLLEKRPTDRYCLGMEECDSEESRRDAILETIQDCDAVLTMRIGHSAQQQLRQKGILSVEYCYTVEDGLRFAQAQLAGSQEK